MTYKMEFSRRAIKNLKEIDDESRTELLRKIRKLVQQPFPDGAKKLSGYKPPVYRIRHGDYRIAYRVEKDRVVILVLIVTNRKDVYKELKRLL